MRFSLLARPGLVGLLYALSVACSSEDGTGMGVGHDSWTMTYDLSNPANDIYAWLATHHK